jgi:hypothetical protein
MNLTEFRAAEPWCALHIGLPKNGCALGMMDLHRPSMEGFSGFPFHLEVQSISYPAPFHYWSFVATMVVPLRAIDLSLLAIPLAALNVPFASYDNDFIEPGYILSKDWSATTVIAQESIVQWADWLAIQGPWCKFVFCYCFTLQSDVKCVTAVTTSKPFPVPSNNPHDYLSWAP